MVSAGLVGWTVMDFDRFTAFLSKNVVFVWTVVTCLAAVKGWEHKELPTLHLWQFYICQPHAEDLDSLQPLLSVGSVQDSSAYLWILTLTYMQRRRGNQPFHYPINADMWVTQGGVAFKA